jgi:hypothetical protein
MSASPIASTPGTDALIAAIGQLEAALPAVSPTSTTPDLAAYNALVQTIMAIWSPLFNLDQAAKAEAAAAAQAAAEQAAQNQ